MRDYDILFGLLAYQLRLLSRDRLAEFADHGARHPDASALSHLCDSGALSQADHDLLVHLVDTLVHAHKGDAKAALDAFGGKGELESTLAPLRGGARNAPDMGADKTVRGTILVDRSPENITTEQIGRYTGGSEYARGGIGRILLVHDEQIGREVILKELLPEHAINPTASTLSPAPEGAGASTPIRQSAAMMARFLQEAKVTGQLEHPSIVPVYELGTRADGRLYYTMKLVRGETLAAAIAQCDTPEKRLGLLRPFLDVCQAMAYAHSRDVIHRDLKPSNIMVGEFGECVVLDWGLAKTGGDKDEHREALLKTLEHLELNPEDVQPADTRAKDVLGTPIYMSPEQARSELDAVGTHSDVYSLGVVLFEILSGEVPHPWSNSRDTVQRVGHTPAPSVLTAAPKTPPELAAICDKALAYDPAKRYANAGELAEDIRHFLEGAVVNAYAYRLRDKLTRLYREHQAVVNSAAVAALAILVIASWSYVRILQAKNLEAVARNLAEQERLNAEQQRDAADEQRVLAERERERAESAERQTADEKYVAEIRLANAYISDGKLQDAEDILLTTEPSRRGFEWSYLATLCNQELATLGEDSDRIFAVHYLPNGTQALSLAVAPTARLWDRESGETVFEWNVPRTTSRAAAISPDGAHIALGTYDGAIYLLDPKTGGQVTLLEANGQQVSQCTFGKDGSQLITGGSDGIVRLWDVAAGQLLRELPAYPGGLRWVGFGEDPAQFIVNTAEDLIVTVDANTGEELGRADVQGLIRGINDTTLLVSGDRVAYSLNTRDLSTRHTIALDAPIRRARVHPGEPDVLLGTEDGLVRLWNGETGAVKRTLNIGQGIQDCQRSPDGTLIFAVDSESVRTVWDVETGSLLSRGTGARNPLLNLAVMDDTSSYRTTERGGAIRTWLTRGMPHRHLWESAPYAPVAIALSDNGNRAAFVRADGAVRVMDTQGGTTLLTVNRQPGPNGTGLCLNADGSRLGVVVDEFLAVVMDVASGEVLTRFEGHDGYITSLAFNADATQIVTTSWDNSARIWNSESGALLHQFDAHTDTVLNAAFSHDGRFLATLSRDRDVIVWNLDTNQERFRISHTGRPLHTTFAPDGSAIATVSSDGGAQVWDTESGTLRFETGTQTGRAVMADFNHDGSRLMTVSSSRINIWNTTRGFHLIGIETPMDEPRFALFAPERPGFLVASKDGNLAHYAALPVPDGPPVTTREALENTVRAFRVQLAQREVQPAATDTALATVQFCRLADLTQTLTHWSATDATQDPVRVVENETLGPILAALGIQDGDEIRFPGADLAAVTTTVQNRAATAAPDESFLTLDLMVTRDGQSRPRRLITLPAPPQSETVTLNREEAQAFLEAGLKMLRLDTDTIFEVNEARTRTILREPLSPGALSGYWILAQTQKLWDAPLARLHLYPGSRITAISGQPITSLTQLDTLCQTALDHLEGNPSFELSISLTRGMFQNVELVLKST